MPKPQFDAEGRDSKTYAPFVIFNAQGPQYPRYLLQFYDWEWLFSTYGADMRDGAIDKYYMNGPGMEGLVKATMVAAGLDPDNRGIFYNSEGDACYIEFKSLDEAVRIAELSSNMIRDRKSLLAMITLARSRGYEDG